MEKIESIRKGNVWLNVFQTEDGDLAVTINKSYPSRDGWKQTGFLNPGKGDITNLMNALEAFHEFEKMSANLRKGSQ